MNGFSCRALQADLITWRLVRIAGKPGVAWRKELPMADQVTLEVFSDFV